MNSLHRVLLSLVETPEARQVFTSEGASRLQAATLAQTLATEVRRASPEDVVLACTRALVAQRDALEAEAIGLEFVATLPGYSSAIARKTDEVVAELLASAKRQIVAVGYEISERNVLASLHAARRRDVDLILIADRGNDVGAKVLRGWPPEVPLPRIYQERPTDVSAMSKMHGKALLVDSKKLLVTSANFTWLGLHGNVEIGVLLTGTRINGMRDLFEELLLHSELLERVKAE